MDSAWNNWFHCMGNTYGTWLRGDPRGWRERHHRRHIEGDYKHPPKKEDYEALNRQSHDLMKRNAVRLERRLRWIALVAIIGSLRSDQVEVLVVSLDDHHLHLIARFQKHNPRRLVGWAKFHATKTVKAYLKAHGAAVGLQLDLREGEGIWAKRSKAVPVRDRDHQVNVCGYSADHGKRGAAVFIHPSVEKALQKMGKLPEKKNPRRRRGLS